VLPADPVDLAGLLERREGSAMRRLDSLLLCCALVVGAWGSTACGDGDGNSGGSGGDAGNGGMGEGGVSGTSYGGSSGGFAVSCGAAPSWNLSGRVLRVGAAEPYPTLGEALPEAAAGDVIEVVGDATYPPVEVDVGGTADSPLVIRGVTVDGQRPVFSGGTDAVRVSANHVVLENLEITAGSERCLFIAADNVSIRLSVVHDCPRHGILGADYGSGSLLLDQVEVHHCGSWPSGENLKHPIYIASDPEAYPNSVFRAQHCFIHDNPGGNSIKSRARRLELYYNWIETSAAADAYYSVEAVGFEEFPSDPGQDADIVGNVLVHQGSYGLRFGGDGTGAIRGQVRLAHNTLLMGAGFDEYTPVLRLDGEADSAGNPGAIAGFESLGNVYYRFGGGGLQLVRDDATWVGGSSNLLGHFDWVPTSSTLPSNFGDLLQGTAPGYANVESLQTTDLNVLDNADILGAGAPELTPATGHELPGALVELDCMPPRQRPTSLQDIAPQVRQEQAPLTLGAVSGP
jgi:hypothetical protein